jgi:hypothetical protein
MFEFGIAVIDLSSCTKVVLDIESKSSIENTAHLAIIVIHDIQVR